MSRELPGDARARAGKEDISDDAALLAAEESGAGPRSPAEWQVQQPISSQLTDPKPTAPEILQVYKERDPRRTH